jgi:hypothetical protein
LERWEGGEEEERKADPSAAVGMTKREKREKRAAGDRAELADRNAL